MSCRTIVAALLVLGFAAPALAGPRIVTPPLSPPAGGLVSCLVANVSSKATLEVRITIYASTGTPANAAGLSVAPNGSQQLFAPVVQGHCAVEVMKGGKRNARVSLQMSDASGTRLGAVNGE